MKKWKKIICCLCVVIILISICIICINSNENIIFKEKYKLISQKISVATIIISYKNKNHSSITESDLKIDENLFNTCKTIINSKAIKSKIEEKYSNINDIELENEFDNSSFIKVIYVCDRENENECNDINNEYISLFIENISNIYDVNISIIDNAEIATRTMEEKYD